MRVTANGWPALNSYPSATFVAPNGHVCNVASRDLAVLFAYLVWRWHTEIEPVTTCYGGRTYAEQMRTNSLAPTSNHVSFTAIDVNGFAHPYEASQGGAWHSGFSDSGLATLRDILREVEVLQWGGDFPSPYRDSMHIQVTQDLDYLTIGPRVVSAGDVKRAARKISARVKAIQRAVGVKADGVAGPGTIEAVEKWQRANDLKADGVFGPKSEAAAGMTKAEAHAETAALDEGSDDVRAIQRKVGVKADGVYGPKTTAAVRRTQRALGVKADGAWGPKTQAAYRRFCDGVLGEATIRLWQTNAGTPVDGKINAHSALIAKVQASSVHRKKVRAKYRLTGREVDGVLGPKTWKMLQDWLGVEIDGVPGPETISALQRRLLRGEW